MNLKEFNLLEKLVTFSDGKDLVQYTERLLRNLIETQTLSFFKGRPVYPVSLILIDINMPTMNGMQTLKTIKRNFE